MQLHICFSSTWLLSLLVLNGTKSRVLREGGALKINLEWILSTKSDSIFRTLERISWMVSGVLLSPSAICLTFLIFFLQQGERVWLWEEEQYLPSTVSSCSGGVVAFATDYGQVCVCMCVCLYAFVLLIQQHSWITVIHRSAARLSPLPPEGWAHHWLAVTVGCQV